MAQRLRETDDEQEGDDESEPCGSRRRIKQWEAAPKTARHEAQDNMPAVGLWDPPEAQRYAKEKHEQSRDVRRMGHIGNIFSHWDRFRSGGSN
jgi:hypothetical protein